MRFTDFTDFEWQAHGSSVRGFKGGDGPPLLLLHGTSHSSRLWEAIAGRLAERHAVVVPDLPFDGMRHTRALAGGASAAGAGDGGSHGETARAAVSPLAHRDIAAEQLKMMESLGFTQFMICGHGEGARVAQRLALDFGTHIDRMMVLDTAPTLPSDDAVVDDTMHAATFGEEVDRELARGDLERGEKIACPVRVLWGEHGAWTVRPLDGWRRIARDTSGRALDCVPCIPEHAPDTLLDEMSRFFDARAC